MIQKYSYRVLNILTKGKMRIDKIRNTQQLYWTDQRRRKVLQFIKSDLSGITEALTLRPCLGKQKPPETGPD